MEVALIPWSTELKNDLQNLADNPNIWDNVRDHFPKPYTLEDALQFIELAQSETPFLKMAIQFKGSLAGGISLKPQPVNYQHSAEIGYWIAEPFWGNGIATQAIQQMTHYGFNELGYIRIYACVYEFNKASMKVLEKCGYRLEGVGKNAVIKNDKLLDEYRYACLPEYLD